jgi:hypothetical protein
MRDVRLILTYTLESFGRKIAIRHLLWGYILRFGMPAIWFTLNPADRRSLLIISLAVAFEILMPRSSADVIRRTAVGNLVVVAEFFKLTMDAFFTAFLPTGTGECGILGEVSNYAGVIKTNGRGMLHLHGFIWLSGNIDFPVLRQKILSDPEFKGRVIVYPQLIIQASIDEDAAKIFMTEHLDETPETGISSQSDEDWASSMKNHGNFVAYKRNTHSYSNTCYKYGYEMVVHTRKESQKYDLAEGIRRCLKGCKLSI